VYWGTVEDHITRIKDLEAAGTTQFQHLPRQRWWRRNYCQIRPRNHSRFLMAKSNLNDWSLVPSPFFFQGKVRMGLFLLLEPRCCHRPNNTPSSKLPPPSSECYSSMMFELLAMRLCSFPFCLPRGRLGWGYSCYSPLRWFSTDQITFLLETNAYLVEMLFARDV